MVKGKNISKEEIETRWGWAKEAAEKAKREEERAATISLYRREEKNLLDELRHARVEEKKYVDEMYVYLDGETIDLTRTIEEHTIQLHKIEMVIDMCKKSLSSTRRSLSKSYREAKPFTKVKEVRNKLEALRKKMRKV